jgi:hypothetical protein
VICVHCGEPTGVSPDHRLTGAEALAAFELERIRNTPPIPENHYNGIWGADESEGGMGIVEVVSAVKTVVDVLSSRGDESQTGMPRAIARSTSTSKRKPAPVTPIASSEPEPAPPPTAVPRYLK